MLPRALTPQVVSARARVRGCSTWTHFNGRISADHLVCEERGGTQVIGQPAQRLRLLGPEACES